MAQFATITGWGKCMPPATLSNADLATFLDTDDEWIRSRTGIHERRISHVSLGEMAEIASRRALAAAALEAGDLDLIVFGTCSMDEQVPNMASLLQNWLGARAAGAMDVNTACTSFLYGLTTASAMIKSGVVRNALVIGGELISPMMDWSNRNVAILFGDGCAAVVLQATDREEGVLADRLGCFGDARGILQVHGMGLATRTAAGCSATPDWAFEGQEIFKRAVVGMSEACEAVLRQARTRSGRCRPRRAAPGEPAHHRGGREARGHPDGTLLRQHRALRQHVLGDRAGCARRGARGGTRQARLQPAADGIRRGSHLVRARAALGRADDTAREQRRRAAALHEERARDGPRLHGGQARLATVRLSNSR